MKKFLFIFLSLIILSLTILKFALPQFSKAQEKRPSIGDNTAVPLSSLSEGQINAAIDNIATLNGGHGGSMVVRVTPGIIESPNMQNLFNKAVQRAESKGVELIMQTDGVINPASMARWINEAPGQNKIAIVVENEANDKNNTGFPGNAQEYADYFVSFAQTVDNDRTRILMTNLNSTCPELDFCRAAQNWYQDIANYNPDAFRYMDGLATSSYGIPPAFDRNFEGVIGFVKELEFLANIIGINPLTFPVYVIETGLQPDPNQMAKYGSNQKEFIKTAMQFWMQHPNIVSLNFFNGQGLNPGWDFFAFMKPGEPIDPELVTLFSAFTSRALIIDEKGRIKVDTSKLFKCEDEEGNFLGYTVDEETCEKLKQLKKQAIFITRSRGTCSTTQQAMKPSSLRPKPCEACNDPFGPQTESCGTALQVYTEGEWCLTPPKCDGDYTETYDWGGDVVIDLTETKIPFAGYGKSPNSEIDTEISSAASKYLADYFTGTLFYGDEEIDTSDPIKYSQEIFRKAGVFRKLASQEVQDIYKRQMISRAKRSTEGREFYPISNYEVENPNYPECPSKTLIEFITGLGKKPLRKNHRTYNEYLTALKEWGKRDNGCWAKLWPAVPMFSLEDAPGQIFVTAQPPGKIGGSPYRATFPHLARLYESSDKLHQLLTPILTTKMAEKAEGFSQDKTTPGVNLLLTPEVKSADTSGVASIPGAKTLLASAKTDSCASPQVLGNLIAQGEIEPQYPIGIDFSAGLSPTDTPGQYRVNWSWSGYTTRDDVSFVHPTYQILVNGEFKAELHLQFHNFKDNPTLTQDMGGVSPVFVSLEKGESAEISIRFVGGTATGPGTGDPKNYLNAAQTCTVNTDGSITGCGVGQPVTGPTPAGPVCQSPDSKKSCSYPKAIMDANKNDPICVSGSENGVLKAGLTVNNYKAKISSSAVRALQRKYDKCMSKCGDDPGEPSCASCDQCSTVKLSRWISIKTEIPWLEKIWDRTTNLPAVKAGPPDLSKSGLFHIFTPANMKPFEPTKGKSPIARYDFENVWGGSGGGASPQSGWLYYPYLGGVQQAKKCISEQFLLPRELQLNQNLCPSILAGKSVYDTTAEENRRRGLCTTLNYEIDYRDTGVEIDENTKENIIEKVQGSWPESLIKEEWNTVYQAARGRGWNPAFVIGLWIEETGASHFVQNGISQDAFGCNPTESKDLTESLNCLFSRPYADEDFKEFMLTYSEGTSRPDEQFCLNPNFPGNIQSWYNQLTK